MPKMQTSFDGLVRLLARNLYTSADVFIRELIQNAHDGCQRRRAVDPLAQARIEITTSATERTIAFLDSGIGMTASDIHEYLSTIGRSGTAIEGAKLAASGVAAETIGQFGVGLLSAFVVADRIDVFTRKIGATEGYHWVSRGGDEYEVTAVPDLTEGSTEITITLKEEFSHFLQEEELVRIIRLYADFVGIPIYVNQEGPVNLRNAPWHLSRWQNQAEKLDAYTNFLRRRYSDRPLLVIPIDIAEPRTRGVLYVTDEPIPGMSASGSVDVYVRRMCIRLRDVELLPEWATFIRGVIDTDLQPTAARDNLQRDGQYQKLRRALGTTIVTHLLALQREKPKDFIRICEWHHVGIKGMALRDDSFFSEVAPHLPFHTNAGVLTLQEYVRRQEPLPNGLVPIYYFSSQGDESQFFQVSAANGLLAINAGRFFDEAVLQRYAERRHDEVEARRMDFLNSRQLYADPTPETLAAFAPALEALAGTLKARDLPNVVPSLRDFAPDSLACVLIEQPGTEALDRIGLLLSSPLVADSVQQIAAEIASRLQNRPLELLLNCRNPLVRTLLDRRDLAEPEGQEFLMGLYHIALLNSQRRSRSETARQLDTYLQARLHRIAHLENQAGEQTRALEAWRKCVRETAAAETADWAEVMKDLAGSSPGDLRERMVRANDREIGELVLNLYRTLQQK